jgi:hypothetical protein
MSYSIQAIIAVRGTFPLALPDGAAVLQLDGGMQMVPLGSAMCHRYAIPLLPLTDGGGVALPSALGTLCAGMSARGPVAYIEAEFFGGYGTQAHALIPAPGADPVILVADDAINRALLWLGVRPLNGQDAFTTVGLGKHRDTDAWLLDL